jgi:hypothetical protein
MSQIGTPLLALFNPRFAASADRSGRSIGCLPDKPMRRSFDSDRSAGLLVIWLRAITQLCLRFSSSNLRATYLIEFFMILF